jgi:hypothetical protein
MSSRYPRPRERGPIAPIHRGPQALPIGASSAPAYAPGAYNLHAPNAALLIDFDNVTMGIRSDLQTELRHLLGSDIIKGKVAVQRAYADWRRYPQYIVPLTESSIDLIFAPPTAREEERDRHPARRRRDGADLHASRDRHLHPALGDSDFSSLVLKLKEYGKYVIGVGIRESSSDLLVQNCDEYYSYNALAGLVRTDEEERPLGSVGAGRRGRRPHGQERRRHARRPPQAGHAGHRPDFDEKDLGMSKFSRFVSEAGDRGLLTLTRQENGQYEIGPVGGRAAAPAAPATRRARARAARRAR